MSNDIFTNKGRLNLIYPIKEIISIIQKHNSAVSIIGKKALLTEKKPCIDWIVYNTPTYKDFMITPLIGTIFPGVNLADKNPSSIYQLWILAILLLTIEYNLLNDTKWHL